MRTLSGRFLLKFPKSNHQQMKVAFITTDNREHWGQYTGTTPIFGTAPEALLEGFSLFPDDVQIHVISCTRQAMNSPAKLADNIYYHSVKLPSWGMMKSLFMVSSRLVRKKLLEIGPDIVHGQGTERECAMAAVKSGYPNILTIHGNMRAMLKEKQGKGLFYHRLAALMETKALRMTQGVCCNSRYTELMVKSECEKTWLVPNPLHVDYLAPLPPPAKNIRRLVLNIGVISSHKGQLEILAIAKKLHQEGIAVEFKFIGACPTDDYGQTFMEKINEASQEGYAHYVGTKNRVELISEMDDADALIHMPKEEAFGLVVAEALARGLKIFSATTGGLIDICESTEGTELFPQGDHEEFAKAIRSWAQHPQIRYPDNHRLMTDRYHPKIIAGMHLKIYKEVVANGVGS